MNRFRPNLVISGGSAYYEDKLDRFRIGEVLFKAVKPCARCIIVNTDQYTGVRSKEPLHTLSGYRKKENKVLFGQNLICLEDGMLKSGDLLSVTS